MWLDIICTHFIYYILSLGMLVLCPLCPTIVNEKFWIKFKSHSFLSSSPSSEIGVFFKLGKDNRVCIYSSTLGGGGCSRNTWTWSPSWTSESSIGTVFLPPGTSSCTWRLLEISSLNMWCCTVTGVGGVFVVPDLVGGGGCSRNTWTGSPFTSSRRAM